MAEKHDFLYSRHGEHAEVPGMPSWAYPLTPKGISSVRFFSKKYKQEYPDGADAYAAPNVRSIYTASLLLDDEASVPLFSSEPVAPGKIEPDINLTNDLQYLNPGNDPTFDRALRSAVQEDRVVHFIAYESDNVAAGNRAKVSTRAQMAKTLLKKVVRVAKIQKGRAEGRTSFFVGREQIYTSLALAAIEFSQSVEDMDKYISAYEESSVTDFDEDACLPKITVRTNGEHPVDSISIIDSVASTSIEQRDIRSFIEFASRPRLQRLGAYVLPIVLDPVTHEESYLFLDYGTGLGLIGGKVEKGETLGQARKREVEEELGLDFFEAFIGRRYIKEPYRFRSARGPEEHHIALAQVADGIDVTSRIQKAPIKMVPKAELPTNRGIFPKLRDYLTKKIAA